MLYFKGFAWETVVMISLCVPMTCYCNYIELFAKYIFYTTFHSRLSSGKVLASGLKVCGFKPGWGRRISKGDKSLQHRGNINRGTFANTKHAGNIQRPFVRHISPTSLPDISAVKDCRRALVEDSGLSGTPKANKSSTLAADQTAPTDAIKPIKWCWIPQLWWTVSFSYFP
jgi:hypothetical protein